MVKMYICFVISMFCELCGKESKKLKKVIIEGASLEVCPDCAKYASGEILHDRKILTQEYLKHRIDTLRRKRHSENDILEENEALIENYGDIVKAAREKMGLTQEELASKINEKSSVIAKIERYELRPDKALIRKLEKFLGIKLIEKLEEK